MKTILVMFLFLLPFASSAKMVEDVTLAVRADDANVLAKYFLTKDVVDNIAQAIRSGNANELSKFFADNVDLKVLEQENIYSRAQAELILRDFFAKHPIEEFTIVHKSVPKNESQFAIGTLKTTNGTYRVHYLMKATGGVTNITQFRIESSDE